MTDIDSTLNERGSRYGDFMYHAKIAQDLQDVMRNAVSEGVDLGWENLPPIHRQALTVIADKIARILSGDPNYADNWHDIQGYAKLVEDRLPVEPARGPLVYAPPKDLTTTAGFLALGAAIAHKASTDHEKDRLVANGMGYDGFIAAVTADAELLEDAWQSIPPDQGFDGVWMYEIVEEYGHLKGKALLMGGKFDSQVAIKKLLDGRIE